MTMHGGLDLFGEELRQAAARDLARNAPAARRRRAIRVGLGGAAVAAAAALTGALGLSGGAGAGVSAADAAILAHVADALSVPAGTILHEQALATLDGRTAQYELWVRGDAPHAYRVIKWGHSGAGQDASAVDPAATLRAMARSGQARVLGTTTVDGVPAYELSVTGSSDRFLNGTAWVARDDYRPLRIDTTVEGGSEQIHYTRYEYLPATEANVALTAPHPGDSGPAPAERRTQG